MNLNRKRRLAAVEKNQSPQKKQKIALYNYRPIRTIEVTNIKDNVSREYLRGYFEHAAGPVSDVSIVRKIEDKQTFRVAYITFSIPEDAARLICDRSMHFNLEFTINEAESARQPKVLNFEQINDDCLLKIASYLDLIDIVHLGKASTRLRAFAVEIYRKRTHFSFGTKAADSSINDTNVAEILQEMGTFIKSIEWYRLGTNDMSHLGQYCPNVTELKLTFPSTDIFPHSITKEKRFFRQLKTLEFVGASIYDKALKTITSSSGLASLELSHCSNVRGKFLSTWKNCHLESLKICNSWKIDCEEVFAFEVKNHLAKLSLDAACSFRQCFKLPAECLSKFKEIELDFSFFNDSYLQFLNFHDFTELTSLTMTYKYVKNFENCNNLLTALSRIPKLESLTMEQFTIDADSVRCLGSFNNLRKIRLKSVKNTIGRQFYSSLHMHLPHLIELSMKMYEGRYEVDMKSICEMIDSLVDLKYFSHSSMSWELLKMILQVQKMRKQSTIHIGISKLMFANPMKKDFVAISKGAVVLTINE